MRKALKTYFTNKDWKVLFEQNKKIYSNNLERVKKSFSAFNANTDLITIIDKDFPYKLNNVKSTVKLPNSIKTITDLKNAITYSLVHGTAAELKISNTDLYYKLLKKIKVKERRIGGQMGIVANTLAELGVHEVIIFTNLLSNKQARLFNNKVLYPSIKNNKLVFKKAKECGRKNDATRQNIIVEYKQKTRIKLKDKTITTPRNNRFIISSPVEKSPPLIPKLLLRRELFEGVSKAFISGYHHIKKKDNEKIFKEWVHQLKTIKKLNPKIKIHLEYVDLHKDWLNKQLFKALKEAHSFGLNETETANIMKYLGNNKLYKGIIKSDYSAETLVKAGIFLADKFKLERVNIHSLQFIISITSKDYKVKIKDLLHANIYGVRVVNSKGVHGMKGFVKGLKSINKYELSSTAVDQSFYEELDKYNIVIVPNFKTETVPVKYTVGLGDTVSSAILYAE